MPVKIEKDNSITISGFEGIGSSVLSDFSDMMGVNTETPGITGVNVKFNKVIESLPSDTFTVAGSAFQVTGLLSSMTYRGNLDGLAVTLSSTGTLPTGLTAGTIYYLSRSGTSTFAFKLSTSFKNMTDGVYVSASDAGTGTHTITPITPKKIKHWIVNGQGRIFALDSDQRLWFGDSNGVSEPWLLVKGNTSTGDGAGLVYYKGFILVFGNGKADALTDIQNLRTTEPIWKNNFLPSSISTDGDARLYFSLNDDAIYFYNGLVFNKYYQIALLEQKAGQVFNPASGATFDLVVDIITLPNEAKPKAINELGENIIIGTESDELYVWNKKSPSFTYFIRLQEENVNSIQVVENIAYIFMEDSASIYYTNLTSTSLVLKLPEQLTEIYYKHIDGLSPIRLTNSAVYNRELLFAVSFLDANLVYNYLYSFNIDTKMLSKKNISSFGESTYQRVNYGEITSIFPFGRNIFIGSSKYNAQVGDVDAYMDYAIESLLYQDIFYSGAKTYRVYNNYEPYIITGLIGVGDVYNKKTLRELQISLARALATGQGITVSYRRDDNSAWTTLKTIDYATNGAIKDIKIEAPITDIIDLQIKINLDGLNSTSPLLKFVRLIP